MTPKIMKVNGEVLHPSTYCGLKEDEWKNQAHIYLSKEFGSNIKDRFGLDVSLDYSPGINLEDYTLVRDI